MSKVIKYSVDHYRKEGVSEEAFEKFFREQHLANALPLFKKYGIIKYCVQRRKVAEGEAFQAMLHSVHPTWNVSKADMLIEYWMPSLDSIKSVVTDPAWEEKAVKGQEDYLDIERGTVWITEETLYMDNNEVVQS